MILQKYLNNESLKYFLHATSKLNWEGILKRGMIWPYVALLKLWDLQIWGKVENSFWEVPILLTFGTGGQREFEDRGQRETQLPPSSSQGTTGEQEEGKEKLLAINQQQREKEGNTTTSSPVHTTPWRVRVNARLSLRYEDLAIYKWPVSSTGCL